LTQWSVKQGGQALVVKINNSVFSEWKHPKFTFEVDIEGDSHPTDITVNHFVDDLPWRSAGKALCFLEQASVLSITIIPDLNKRIVTSVTFFDYSTGKEVCYGSHTLSDRPATPSKVANAHADMLNYGRR